MAGLFSQSHSGDQSPVMWSTASGQPLLTVIIPVYNEVKTLNAVLHRVVAIPIDKQIVVIDDGSTDGSGDILSKWSSRGNILVLSDSTNRGKGYAVRTGLQRALGAYTIVQDADLEYDPQDIVKLMDVLQSRSADVVLGSRYLGSPNAQVGRLYRLGVGLLNALVKLLYHVTLTDEATCYKAAPTSTFRRMDLQCERFEICSEFIAKACRMRLRIQEVAISYYPRTAKEGKKLRLRDGWAAARALWKWRRWSEEQTRAAPAPSENAP